MTYTTCYRCRGNRVADDGTGTYACPDCGRRFTPRAPNNAVAAPASAAIGIAIGIAI